jgi:hypothetical protein
MWVVHSGITCFQLRAIATARRALRQDHRKYAGEPRGSEGRGTIPLARPVVPRNERAAKGGPPALAA